MMASSAESIGVNGAAAPTQLFVINLAASTSPMALSHPSSPELKRYTFFVSRQREDGRERFRLHMGYFHSQEEAETLLASVRDVYPAAWAGPAPTTGMGRRGRIAPGSVVSGSPPPVTPAAAAEPAMPAATAAAPVVAAPVAAAPAALAVPASPAAPVPPQAAAAPVTRAVPAAVPAAAPRPVVASTRAAVQSSSPSPSPSPSASASTSPSAPAAPPLDAMSNVRDVLAQLSESASADAPTVQMRMPPMPAPATTSRAASAAAGRGAPPELSPVAALSLLETPARTVVAPPASRAAHAVAKAVSPARSPAHLPTLPPLKSPFEGLEGEPEVRLVTPEDTQTLTDIKLDRQNNAPPCFAVQLVWSVSPIDVAALPHLAIFEAYTLYNVEGNRQGRRWYGLRLGFFSDPNSATQVANYVRSDYTAVAVVPVAVKERDRAKGGTTPLAEVSGGPRKAAEAELAREGMEGFELLTDDRPPPAKRDLEDAARRNGGAAPAVAARVVSPPRTAGTAGVAAAPAAPKSTGKPVGKRVVARRRPPPVPMNRTVSAGVGGAEVLESTLEILGASTLSLDEGREIINDNAARRPAEKKPSGNRFSRLLSRLGGG